MEIFIDFFQWLWDWFSIGIYDFFKGAFVLLTKYAILAYYKSFIFLLDVSYTAFIEIVEALNISDFVKSNYSSLPENVKSALAFFGIPEALNVIFSAFGTRLTMRFVPFLGR